MLFNSLPFALFFAVASLIYWGVLSGSGTRKVFLLGASLWFYGQWNTLLVAVLCISTLFDFWVCLRMQAQTDDRHRRFLMRLSVGLNLSLLFLFKYLDFGVRNLTWLLGWMLHRELVAPEVFLPNPIGISFYTFEAISYSVDVYRGKARVERSFPNLLLFITFFPHVVAGPIMRARDFLPQIARPKRWSWLRAELGMFIFCRGLFKKLAVADRMSLIVDPVFLAPIQFSTVSLAGAALAYSLQIYCDFSGYSDMAVGLAHLFGYRLCKNFEHPYAATNIASFWRRWHISLSSWLRDYLYIPLGGNARGRLRTHLNLWTTMLLGGLWHGANWNFVLWGGLHGLFLSLHRLYRRALPPMPAALGWMFTFTAVTLAWIPFRSSDFSTTLLIFQRLLMAQPGKPLPVSPSSLVFSLGLVGASSWVAGRKLSPRLRWRLPAWFRGLVMATMLVVCFCLSPKLPQPFIYFQF